MEQARYQFMKNDAGRYDVRWRSYLENTQKEILQYVHLKPGQHLLDVGSGTGLLLQKLSRRYPQNALHGVELAPDMMQIAERRLKGLPVTLAFGDAERLPFPKDTFDIVTCSSVLHYLTDPEKALQEMLRVLKRHGHLILLDWNRDPFLFRLMEHFYFRQFFRQHVKTYTVKEATQMLERTGFTILSTKRWHHSFWSLMLIKAEKV